ncbi:asparagine synthase-related protein [Thalassomonas sp. RHCl1]|uniref:asparagine synthase-related protein n=1 Tax=Thalassomonas sp. RHCl1 TaxID=2995320 RepID=UPI00248A9138|nr:asparagine synthase-related protein [Thalassomonas sp. RHCl1]
MHGLFFQDTATDNKKAFDEIWRFNPSETYRHSQITPSCDFFQFDGQSYDESYYQSEHSQIFIDGSLALTDRDSTLQQSLAAIEAIYLKNGYQGVIAAIAAGSFNLAIVDKKAEKVLFLNDFIGSIPLYYAKSNLGTVVSTNPIALFNSGLFPTTLDMTGVASYAHLGYAFGSRHITRELNKLPANCCLEYDLTRKTSKILKGHNNLFETFPERQNYHREKYARLINKACSRVANTSGKTASFLSGGLDSRMVTAAWPKDHPLEHFTYGAPQSAEIEFAKQVARLNGEPLHHVIPDGGDIAAMIENIFDFSGLACFPERYFFAQRMAQQGFNSVNDGFLIDVFLGGDFFLNDSYLSPVSKLAKYLGLFIDQSTSKHSTEAIAEAYFDSANLVKSYDQLGQYLDPDFIGAIKQAKPAILDDICTEVKRFAQHTDSVAYIFRNITAANRSVNYTLSQGVNARQFLKVNYPLGLDKELIYTCLELSPMQAAYRRGQLRALKDNYPAFAQIPYSRTRVPATYPAAAHKWASILNGKGIYIPGFNDRYKEKSLHFSNWGHWFKDNRQLRDIARNWLLSGNITDSNRIASFFAAIAENKTQASGHIFHIAGISKWISRTL